MIPECFFAIDPLTSLGGGDHLLETWHRNITYRVLAATSTRLRMIFYKPSWRTRVMRETDLPIMVKFLKQINVQVHAHLVEYVLFSPPETLKLGD